MKPNQRIHRSPRLADVPLGKMRVNQAAQRELNTSRADHIAETLNMDELGFPVLSERDGSFYVLDGQHRIAAVKKFLGNGWEDQCIKCEVYTGLTEPQEAEIFLRLNEGRVAVRAYDAFRAAVKANRKVECAVERIVHWQNLTVSKSKQPGGITAVGTIVKVYRRSNEEVLGKALRIIRDAYGDAGFEAAVIDGIGHLCQRYNGQLDEEQAVKKLGGAHGGVNGLLGRAEQIRKQTGAGKNLCIAAAAVEFINSGKGGKKLPGWWSQ